jgi:signal transduction histidine kinase
VRGQAVATAARLENALLAQTTATGLRGVDAERWWSAATTELELVRAAEIALLADVLTGIERARADQWRQTGLVTGVTLAILALSLLTSAGIGRSMGTSLRRLHARAMDVAHVQLPDLLARLRQPATPLPRVDQVTRTAAAGQDGAGGADEVGEVARAFTEVHRAAVGLAVEQARMRRNVGTIFVHLARRSQVLVERQLELLDDLERDETEPDRLKNLFRLDHLATRQRRNNDSLLVLADADTVRRYDLPTPLHGAAVAAVSEIEAYERVHDRVTAEERVAGHAVADLVHLLAELLDNATTFSEPHTIVTVADQRWTGPDGETGIALVVTDAGIGMSAEALAAANALLAAPPPIDVATSERMGLVVVGHLAARHGIQVRLEDTSPGVRATVWLPGHMLTAPLDALPALPGGDPPAHRTPVRPEDVPGGPQPPARPGPDNLWWARPDEQPAPPTRTRGLPPPPPQAVNGRTRTNGLPIRTPLAQLPAGRAAAPLPPPAPLVHQDPDQAGAALSALYRGVRQAQSELDGEPPTQEFKPIEKDHRDEPEPTSP